jgi:hypothetical protein
LRAPLRIWLDVVVGRSQIRSTWPERTSMAGPAPLYCTIVSGTPVSFCSSMAQRCVTLPMPDEAMVSFSRLALA